MSRSTCRSGRGLDLGANIKRTYGAERLACLFLAAACKHQPDLALSVRAVALTCDNISTFKSTLIVQRIRAWRAGGFAALAPPARQVTLRTDAQVLELAAGLKRENLERTAAQVRRILLKTCGWSPSVRTLLRHFERLELVTRPGGRPPAVFGRFEAGRPNELWTGDALHGPVIAARKAYLFAFIDDHSRLSRSLDNRDYPEDGIMPIRLRGARDSRGGRWFLSA